MTLARDFLALCFVFFASALGAEPLRVVVISDLNGSYGSVDYDPRVSAAVDTIIGLNPDFVVSTGDMVAGQRRPHLAEAKIRAMWKGFHEAVTDPLEAAGIPLIVTPGNHDASAYEGFDRERRIYEAEWVRRRPERLSQASGDYPFHYAFDAGPVRFISLDATTVGALDPAQMAWLRRQLGDGHPSIVFSHLPLWPVAEGRETEVIGDPELEALFREGRVRIALSGHHHAYYPGARDGIAYVAQACLGSGPRRLIGSAERSGYGFTLLDIAEDGTVLVSARSGPDFRNPVPIARLPEFVGSALARLDRLDLSEVEGVRSLGSP